MLSIRGKFVRRKRRNTKRILLRKNNLPRLSVFRSNNHMYAQLIDDVKRCTIVSASSMDKGIASKVSLKSTEIAALVGKALAERAVSKGIEQAVFDRGGYLFHGRVKSLADAARNNGLRF